MWTFTNPTCGELSLEELVRDIESQIESKPQDKFRVIIGSDSQPKRHQKKVTFVTAIVLHHVGKGARYYVHREEQEHVYSLRQRMFTEASYSLQVGMMLSEHLMNCNGNWNFEVHLDVGERGATKQVIREIVAWIEANGYEAKVKPDSYGASKVADRYTKR